jgi:hypothetical protein
MRSRWQNFREGRHARLLYDEGLGWMVMVRGQVLDSPEALESPVPRIRRLAKWVALHDPDQSGLKPAEVSFIWPQRGSDKGAT